MADLSAFFVMGVCVVLFFAVFEFLEQDEPFEELVGGSMHDLVD